MWHGAALLPMLRAIPAVNLIEATDQASAISQTVPLHMQPYASDRRFEIPALEAGKKYSGCQVIAIMVFGLWVMCGEDEAKAGPLIDSWPIREAIFLAPK